MADDTRPTGTIIYVPEPKHRCAPGFTIRERVGDGLIALVPPSPWDFPEGTVWACECGKTWVSQGSPASHMPGVCTFRPEGRFERRRRLRRSSHGA